MRIIAKAYSWTPTEMGKLTADEVRMWTRAAVSALEGKY